MPDRTPYCTKIRYGITGTPILDGDEMDGTHAPGVGLAPKLVELVYTEPRDGKPASVTASVTGDWTRFGKRDPDGFGGQMTTHFTAGPDGWPAWLADEARLHAPQSHGVAVDRAAILRELADGQTQLAIVDDLERNRSKAAARRELVKELRRLAAASGPHDTDDKTGQALVSTTGTEVSEPRDHVMCGECGHTPAAHTEGEDPVSPGACAECPDGEDTHDYLPPRNTEAPPPLRIPDHVVNEEQEVDGQPPTPADRAAVLREAAELAEVRAAGESSLSSSDYDAEAAAARALRHLANHLRTMAAAVPQPGGGAGCSARPCNAAADELCDHHARIKYHGDGEHAFCAPGCTEEASS